MENQSDKQSGFEAVLKRNQYYWECYQEICLAIVLMLVFIFGLIGFIWYLHSTPPAPKYFATSPDGVPIEIVPLNIPLQTPEYVLEWAKKAVISIYALDFITFRKTLQDDDIYFTWLGHVNFLRAYKISNNLEAVKAKKQVVSVEVTGPGQIKYQGQRTSDMPYSWDLTIPATFTYQNSENDVVKQSGNFVMTIVRDSTLRHPDGIAISQLVFIAS
jgi:intracellular multiplication protein IcmL